MKQHILIGGLGNCLYQIDHMVRVTNGEVVFITNLISSKTLTRCIGWTYHEPEILNLNFHRDIIFAKKNTLRLLVDLIMLFTSKKLARTILNTWRWGDKDDGGMYKVNGGYFQYYRNEPYEALISSRFIPVDRVVHLRLGDSPSINSDVAAIKSLLSKSNDWDNCIVVTNDVLEAKKLFGKRPLTYCSNSILEDFELLRSAKNLVVSRSTFSMFAAYSSDCLENLWVASDFWDTLGFNANINVFKI